MKSLVIGASGLVGAEIYKQLVDENFPVVGTYASRPMVGMKKLDIRNYDAVISLVENEAPDVIYLAAYESWVDYCETYPEESAETNVYGCYNVIDAAQSVGATIVFFSSSYVFSGREVNTVTTVRNPLNVYGAQKVLVEDYIMKNCAKFFIVRTVGVFGNESKNFFGQVRRKLEDDEVIYASDNQYMNPIYVVDLVRKTLRLNVGYYDFGIYHIAGDTVLSKKQFAKRIVGELSGKQSLVVSADDDIIGTVRPVHGDLYCNPLMIFPANFPGGLRRLVNE